MNRDATGTNGNMNDHSQLPTSRSQQEGHASGDDAMEDDLTEERQVAPAKREEVAHDLEMDPQ